MSFVAANVAYESWMHTQCDVVEDGLKHKHKRMKENAFLFLRATFFRWPHLLKSIAPDHFRMPAPLAVGDSHLENFGTWRDAEVRLVWGVNDHDDASHIPAAKTIEQIADREVPAEERATRRRKLTKGPEEFSQGKA